MSILGGSLTKAQWELLHSVRKKGELWCNGRRERTVKALADRGLVNYELRVLPDCKRGTALFWVVTPRPRKPISPVKIVPRTSYWEEPH